MKPKPPQDTPQTRRQLHDAIRERGDTARILALVGAGADPSTMLEGDNAYSLTRRLGYSDAFIQAMEDAFSPWLEPLNDLTVLYITDHARGLWDTLERNGWTVWCKGTGQLGAFAWMSTYRLYHSPWEMEASERMINGHMEIDLGLPRQGFGAICRLLESYGVAWSTQPPSEDE
jgi:hypothetical protein